MLLPLLFVLFTSAHAQERRLEEKPVWEAGLATGLISLPHYMGSDERYLLPLAFPYIIYRGEVFKVDRQGLRSRLLETMRMTVDLDFGFGLPVKKGNKAREGMPPLYLTGQVGPQLNWYWLTDEHMEAVVHLPVRGALNVRGDYIGWLIEPSMHVEFEDFGPGEAFSSKTEIGLLYASQRYNDTYYGVAPQYATATRPAYQARQGLHSIYLSTNLNYEVYDGFWTGVFLRLRDLSQGVVADSPLVKSKYYTSVGIGFIWRLGQSDDTVMAEK